MKKVKFLMFSAVLLLAFGFNSPLQDAATILKKLDGVMYSAKDMIGKTKIIITTKNGKKSIREATIKQKGTDRRLFRFTSPASQAGIATLSLPNDVMYLYMPAFGKERRISSSVKSQKFAGTDFSYEDMESKKYSDKYKAKLLKPEAAVYVLELIPKSSKSAYSKLIIKVNKVNYYPTYTEFYDKGKNKVKVAYYTFEKVGNYWNAKEVNMKDIKRKHSTKMIMSDVKFDTGLSDDEFTLRELKQ